jgi:hypothetical protein
MTANGHVLLATDLVKHRFYQEELIRLLRSLTEEGSDGRLRAAMTDTEAAIAAVKFRMKHGLEVLAVDPLIYAIGLHRARIRHKAMTPAEKNYSEHWLIREGHGTDVDTLFNPKPEKAKEGTS